VEAGQGLPWKGIGEGTPKSSVLALRIITSQNPLDWTGHSMETRLVNLHVSSSVANFNYITVFETGREKIVTNCQETFYMIIYPPLLLGRSPSIRQLRNV
jgi:hypothetical protein